MSEWQETEFGLIPKDWEIQNSSMYCTKITDGTHDSPKQVFSGYPLITSKHIKSDSINFEEAYLISKEDYEAIVKRSKVDQYDLIISMIGEYCGFTYLERSQKVNYATKNVGLFKNRSMTHALWLKYYLDSPIGKHQLRLRRSETSQPYISLGSLRNLPILTPKSDITRQSIVNILSCLDAKIENLRRQNETLEQIAQTLFKHWFIDFEFPFDFAQGKPNADGKPYKSSGGAMFASELGDIPEGWYVTKLENLTKISTGKSLKKDEFKNDGTYPVLGANGEMGRTDKFLTEEESILTGRVGTLGIVNINYSKAWISDNVIIFNPTSNFFYYVYFCLRNTNLKNLNRGSTQPLITQGDLKKIDILNPDIRLITNFQIFCQKIFNKKRLNDKQIETLTKTRDSLLPKLMSGQLRVKE